MPATSTVSPPSSQTSGCAPRTVIPGGVKVAGSSIRTPLACGCVHRRTGLLGEIGEADDVVEVAVRDEDRRAARTDGGERLPDRGGIAARVDHDRLGRLGGRPDEIRVGPDRPELELVDGERHGFRV